MEEELFIEAEEIENVSEKDMEELKESVEKYTEELVRHEENINNILDEINNSKVYKELGIEIALSTEYMYSIDSKDEN